jgi:hypothetical protein
MSLRAATSAITKSSHLMALHTLVSASLLLSLPLVVRAALGMEITPTAAEFVVSVVTAICTAGGVIIGASATRHTGEGYAKARSSSATVAEVHTPAEPYRGD